MIHHMKKITVAVLFLGALIIVSCNQRNANNELSSKNSLLLNHLSVFQRQLQDYIFKLYPTKNTWTFLELNSITGTNFDCTMGSGEFQTFFLCT